jgi:hypothetical protein
MEQIIINAVIAGGVYHLLFGILHLVFPFALRWKETLMRVDGTNRNLLPVFNLWVAYAIFAWSYVSFWYPDQIANTALGHGICWSIVGIWTFRHMMQVYYMGFSGSYLLPRPFLGLRSIHALAFAPIFSLGSALYLIPVLRDDVTAWVTTVGAIAGLLLASLAVHLRRAGSISIQGSTAAAPAMATANPRT